MKQNELGPGGMQDVVQTQRHREARQRQSQGNNGGISHRLKKRYGDGSMCQVDWTKDVYSLVVYSC